MRCSEADCLSRVLLTQASRQATVSLILSVGHNHTISSRVLLYSDHADVALGRDAKTRDSASSGRRIKFKPAVLLCDTAKSIAQSALPIAFLEPILF